MLLVAILTMGVVLVLVIIDTSKSITITDLTLYNSNGNEIVGIVITCPLLCMNVLDLSASICDRLCYTTSTLRLYSIVPIGHSEYIYLYIFMN